MTPDPTDTRQDASFLQYQWNVHLLGPVALRINRWIAEGKARSARSSANGCLAPPLDIAPRTKELIYRHYLTGRYANGNRKVAWVTSGAPSEMLKALDFYVYYPENHGAVCGASRVVVELAGEAESAGYSIDLCSYARTDLGSLLSGKTPVGRLPRPDLLLACTNICQTVLAWYRVLAETFHVPLILIDTPFVYTQAGEHALEYVRRQIEEAIPVAERIAQKTLDARKLHRVVSNSRDATQLWLEILNRSSHHPAPISVFDQFIHMAPIVEMRGEAYTVDFYAALLKEVDRRITQGIGAVREEKKRLLWDNLPIWYRLRFVAELLGERGAALIASTYTNAWAELSTMIDPDNPMESAARTYLHPILNQGTGHKLETMLEMVEKYDLDGAILHSDRSCKPYSIGQIDQRDRLIHDHGLPALLLEADHNDPRAFSEEQTANRLEAFLEILGV